MTTMRQDGDEDEEERRQIAAAGGMLAMIWVVKVLAFVLALWFIGKCFFWLEWWP